MQLPKDNILRETLTEAGFLPRKSPPRNWSKLNYCHYAAENRVSSEFSTGFSSFDVTSALRSLRLALL